MALPPGMFSAAGTMPTTRMGAFSIEMARMAQMTAAPPAMSSFIRSMPSAGLIEIPPVSNVMPLPTSPSTGEAGALTGSCRSTIMRGGVALPCPTPSRSPIFLRERSSSSRISTASPALVPIARARSASTEGVSTFDGSLQRSRAMFDDSPRMTPRSTARSRLEVSPTPGIDDQQLLGDGTHPFPALVGVPAEGGQDEPLGDRLRRHGARQLAVAGERQPRQPPLTRRQRRRGSHAPEPLAVDIVRPSAANQGDALGAPTLGGRADEQLVPAWPGTPRTPTPVRMPPGCLRPARRTSPPEYRLRRLEGRECRYRRRGVGSRRGLRGN